MHSLDECKDASLGTTAIILLSPLSVFFKITLKGNVQSLEISVLNLQLISFREKARSLLVELVDLLCKVISCLFLIILILLFKILRDNEIRTDYSLFSHCQQLIVSFSLFLYLITVCQSLLAIEFIFFDQISPLLLTCLISTFKFFHLHS